MSVSFAVPTNKRLRVTATFNGPWEEEVRIFEDAACAEPRVGFLGAWNGRDSDMDRGPKVFESPINRSGSHKTYYFTTWHKRGKPHGGLEWFQDPVSAQKVDTEGDKKIVRCDTYEMISKPVTTWPVGPDGHHYPETHPGPIEEHPSGNFNGMRVEIVAID